jgi:multicomponent Na+:H+ antiporter subunit C
MTSLYAITAGLLFGAGLYGVLVRPGLIQRLLAMNVMATSVFLYLVLLAAGPDGSASDPVPQAMVLTGIVVAISVTAFGLALARWFRSETGVASLESVESEDDDDRG